MTPLTLDELLEFTLSTHHYLQDRYRLDFDPYAWALANMVKLSEEVGELSEQVLASGSIQRSDKVASSDALAAEVADVLITAIILGHTMDVDIRQALMNKMTKIKQRQLDNR